MRARLQKFGALRAVYRKCLRTYLEIEGYLALLALKMRKPRAVKPNSDLVVSLTTYHARLKHFPTVLDSLICQDIDRDYSIVAHLSACDLPGGRLPSSLEKYQEAGVEFHVHQENHRSYKKLVYEYGRSRGRIIVTADDDVIYPKYWLRRMMDAHARNPECVVAYRAHFLECVESRFIPYVEMMKIGRNRGERLAPRYDLMPTGVSGVLYPPESLDPMCNDSDLFLEYAPTADDIWFKVASLLRGTRCVQVERKNRHFPFVPGSQASALHNENIDGARNDVQLDACFSAFPGALGLIVEGESGGVRNRPRQFSR